MARAYNPTPRLLLNPITIQLPSCRSHGRGIKFALHAQLPTEDDYHSRSLKKVEVPKNPRKSRRRGTGARRSLVSVGTSCGGWENEWSCDFVLTLRQLQLGDLTEDGYGDAKVLVHLLIQQHARFGLSIKGRIVTSFNRKCDCCSSSYCSEIDEHFDVWVLSSSRNRENEMPKIGGDPSVIYVKPGSEAYLDSLIQDTIRLTASAKNICSEACEKSTVVWQYDDGKKHYDGRWSKLLELKKALDKMPS